MHIRWGVLGIFGVVLLIAAYLGFTPHPENIVHDKLQHFLVFFFLTLLFYWIIDTTKRRILNMTILFSLIVDIGSEVLQALIVPSRVFDLFDILANLCGSACALGLNIVYHKRQLARKTGTGRYTAVPPAATGDLELGGGEPIVESQESGIVAEQDIGTIRE